jgi:WD40 repeat protein
MTGIRINVFLDRPEMTDSSNPNDPSAPPTCRADPDDDEEEDFGEDDHCEIVLDENPEDNEEEDSPGDVSISTFAHHTDSVYCVAFRRQLLADGSLVFASGGGDDIAHLYHMKSPSPPTIFALKGHTDSINAVAFSPDGSLLATGGLEGVVHTWDPLTGTRVATLSGPSDSIEWRSWHPSIPALLGGDRNGLTWLWNAKTGKCAKVYSQHQGPVTAGGFRPDGSEIWSVGEDAVLRVWSPRTAQPTATVHGHNFHRNPICAGACSPSGALAATGDVKGVVIVVRFGEVKVLGSLDAGKNSVECIAFAPGNKWIAVASMGGAATVWSPIDFKLRHAMTHPAGVIAVKWHPSRPYLVTACADGAIRVWDIRNGALLSEMPGHEDVITAMDIRPVDGADGDLMIVSASDDRTVKLWSFVESPELKPT